MIRKVVSFIVGLWLGFVCAYFHHEYQEYQSTSEGKERLICLKCKIYIDFDNDMIV